jgi:hypothetical protein
MCKGKSETIIHILVKEASLAGYTEPTCGPCKTCILQFGGHYFRIVKEVGRYLGWNKK